MIEIGKGGQRVELFGVQVPGINKHLKNIFDAGELAQDSVVSILETTAADGKNDQTRCYNLEACPAREAGRGSGRSGKAARAHEAQEAFLTSVVKMDTF